MRRSALLLAVLAACGAAAEPGVPFADAPGSRFAPLYSPPPSPRGVPPTILSAPSGRVLCNDMRLLGKPIGAIAGKLQGCGVKSPVRVTSIAGVALSSPVRVNCRTAVALADWTDQHAKPEAVKLMGSRLVKMKTVASYSCRTRNHRKGARISEHGKGNAVDIAGFSFSDGEDISVLKGWHGVGKGYLNRIWLKACSDFGTVLGPNADKFHRDHFHFDTAKHRGGPYCR
jgi:hypothetical protein